MEISFLGTEIPVKVTVSVWDKKVKYVSVRTKNKSIINEDFWNDTFTQHLQAAVRLAEENKEAFLKKAIKETGEEKLKLKSLSAIMINFSDDEVYYDYYINVGKLLGGFSVHIKGTPEGELTAMGIS